MQAPGLEQGIQSTMSSHSTCISPTRL